MEKTMAVIAFTEQGRRLARKLIEGLGQKNKESESREDFAGFGCLVTGYAAANAADAANAAAADTANAAAEQTSPEALAPFASLKELVRQLWPQSQALIFIGACGIAVRSIAPYVKDKTRDPAVLVLDEKGQFVISLLSGHIGGANRLTLEIADLIGAQPVITTATDINQVFAVDSWAVKAGLHIVNPQVIKEISGSLLAGRPVGLTSQYPIEGPLPAGIEYLSDGHCAGPAAAGIRISSSPETSVESPFNFTLNLLPKNLILGCGCRRGASEAQIREAATGVLLQYNLSPHRLRLISSIDLKSNEKGLLDFAASLDLPLVFFSAAELAQVPGDFTASAYVKEVTGVDNVCERSALLGARNISGGITAESSGNPENKTAGRLLIPKTSLNGVTIAVYEQDFTVIFP